MNSTSSRRYPEVAQELRHYISAHFFSAGEKLPAERVLAEKLDVSRALLREALIMLEIQGLVEVRQGSGVYVRQTEHSGQKLAEDDIGPFELLQARQVLESSIAEIAAQMVTKRDIEDLQKILNEQKNEVQNEITDYDTDERFHIRVAEATQNRVLLESVNHLWQIRRRSPMWVQLHSHISHTTYWQQWVDDHQAIFNALKRKDPAAARQSMWQHLENVRETVFALSDVDEPDFDGFLFQSFPLSSN